MTEHEHIIDDLYQILLERKEADPSSSYVASLYKDGIEKITRKLGEESTETIIEALSERQDKTALANESADLLFHLMVLWAYKNITPDEVFHVLEKRFGTSGLKEKETRNKE